MSKRWGLTVPRPELALLDHANLVRTLPAFGYTDIWSAETNGIDAFTPLTLASAWEPSLRLGTAIVLAYTRGPALIEMSTAALAAAAPGRFILGLGASSPVIVRNWNGTAFDEPYRRIRGVLRVVRTKYARRLAKKLISTYLTVPAYAAFHNWSRTESRSSLAPTRESGRPSPSGWHSGCQGRRP
jgi:alkanesulfonate monooxygenase SsuD/methylene tetrahydromethanopterin reductase-like flavin-dependent oxidoreductase (luciferase family)